MSRFMASWRFSALGLQLVTCCSPTHGVLLVARQCTGRRLTGELTGAAAVDDVVAVKTLRSVSADVLSTSSTDKAQWRDGNLMTGYPLGLGAGAGPASNRCLEVVVPRNPVVGNGYIMASVQLNNVGVALSVWMLAAFLVWFDISGGTLARADAMAIVALVVAMFTLLCRSLFAPGVVISSISDLGMADADACAGLGISSVSPAGNWRGLQCRS